MDEQGIKKRKLSTSQREPRRPRRQRGSIGAVSSGYSGIKRDSDCYPRTIEALVMATQNFQGLFDRRKEENRQKRVEVNRKKQLQQKIKEELEKLSETQQFLRQVK